MTVAAELKQQILADGKIDADEVEQLREQVFADGKVDGDEVQLLRELRDGATTVDPSFEVLFFMSLRSNVLEDGAIDAAEASLLRSILYADGEIDQSERVFLTALKAEAVSTCPEFDTLYNEAMGIEAA